MDLKAPPLPDPLLHFAEEREKTLSDVSHIALIQLQWGRGEGEPLPTAIYYFPLNPFTPRAG